MCVCWIGNIHIADPKSLDLGVLGKYYRHCKYSSFQRQLNYFGWRKVRGPRGKMAPCTYFNDKIPGNADMSFILQCKRREQKTSDVLPPSKKKCKVARSHEVASCSSSVSSLECTEDLNMQQGGEGEGVVDDNDGSSSNGTGGSDEFSIEDFDFDFADWDQYSWTKEEINGGGSSGIDAGVAEDRNCLGWGGCDVDRDFLRSLGIEEMICE